MEDKIYYYCDPYYRIYLEHYRKNKSKTIVDCNIKINGQLQKELFPYLPLNRKSKKIEDLEKVLEKKFLNDKFTKFKKENNFYGGTVVSPIKSKEIGEKQWLKILTNKKLYDKFSSWTNKKENETKIKKENTKNINQNTSQNTNIDAE